MKLIGFHVQMYKGILDSDWIDVNDLTVLVGKNEAGKTSLLKALHKLNPYNPEPYSMDREWPRGYRQERDSNQIVCTAEFLLTEDEISELSQITDQQMTTKTVKVTRDYAGRLEVLFPEGMFPDKLHPTDIDRICSTLPTLQEPVSPAFKEKADEFISVTIRFAHEGHFTDLTKIRSEYLPLLEQSYSSDQSQTQYQNESAFVSSYSSKLDEIGNTLQNTPSIQKRAHEYVVKAMPTFIYMSDYRAFTGTARLDQVKQRQDSKQLSEEDKTIVMIMELSGLSLEEEVAKGTSSDREQRQYDLDDASSTITRTISERWRQRKYEVEYRADGQLFYTFVKDDRDPSLIKLEERSKGFQWFFSFDLMFMYESNGTFENCVLLLDEPGLHLHPDAQKDLLRRMENYAEDNTLIYSTHLPFMIDLTKPDSIRILNETANGTVVSSDLTQSQPEAKLVLQAALGMSGSTSYLVAQKNLVVEGVDDYWIITELSNLLKRSGKDGLSEEIFITPAGGASEAAYIATFMMGQKLDVAVLLDNDKAGDDAQAALVKKWLTKYSTSLCTILRLGDIVNSQAKEFSIEDLFTDDYYMAKVRDVYKKQLDLASANDIKLREGEQLSKRVAKALEEYSIPFNKGSVAKIIRKHLSSSTSIDGISSTTIGFAERLIKAINKALEVAP